MLIKSQSTVPTLMYDAFCKCKNTNASWPGKGDVGDSDISCLCGEEHENYEWRWDEMKLTRSTTLSENKRDVFFHQTFSSGTAAVRGNIAFEPNRHYYWEIKMLSALYGTDVMVGVGTENVVMNLWPYRFCSMLGMDKESWGYSYRGHVQHDNVRTAYGPRFGQGTIIGVHLDMCSGTLEFFHNRRPLGIAFTGLKRDQKLYPMACSTAAQSAMRMTCSLSIVPSLQLLTIQKLAEDDLINVIDTVPGLKNMLSRQFWWLIPDNRKKPRSQSAETSASRMLIYEEDTDDEIYIVTTTGSAPSCSKPRKASKRKRKRESPPKSNTKSNTEAPAPHLTDGPSSSRDLLPPIAQIDPSDAIFAACESCGIIRAVGTKRSNKINKNRVCIYCDGLI